jgi:hypothetical protein
MPDPSAFLPSLAILLLIGVMLWFALGTQRNIRRGNDLLRWAQGGLPLLGKRATLRWLGSSAVEVSLADPVAPFREAQLLAILEPRDVGWIWAVARARGRRDFLIVRGTLRRSPTFDLEAGHSRGWTARDGLARLDERVEEGPWLEADWGPEVRVRYSPGTDIAAMHRTWDRLAAASGGLWRLSVQRVVPHLEVHLIPPDTAAVPSERLFRTVIELAEELDPKSGRG